MAILKRVGLGRALTHPEMDENFSSVYFSSSLENNANTLRLYYDTDPITYDEYPLNAGNSIGIVDNGPDRVLTATTNPSLIRGNAGFTYNSRGYLASILGRLSLTDSTNNVLVGFNSGVAIINTGNYNTAVGNEVAKYLIGEQNTLLGYASTQNALTGDFTTAVGGSTLGTMGRGNNNVALGYKAGFNLAEGFGNIYIGTTAGPAGSSVIENNQLYINNFEGTPLIGGDFSARTVDIDGALAVSQNVNAVSFTGSFQGDGSGLTNIPTTGWDGIRNGNAQITGSLIVSGAVGTIVDFTGVSSISGSIFSGSFRGDGSQLTGVVGEWDGSRNGNGEITGSFIVSGSLPTIQLNGITTIDNNIIVKSINDTGISIGSTLSGQVSLKNDVIVGILAGDDLAISVNPKTVYKGGRTLIGYAAGRMAGGSTVCVGDSAGAEQSGTSNVIIGYKASSLNRGTGVGNTVIGAEAAYSINQSNSTVAIGASSLYSLRDSINNVAIGVNSLKNLKEGSGNVAIGTDTGLYVIESSRSNIYIGNAAGPEVNTIENGKLYINNTSGNPLIGGDFNDSTVTISGSLLVSQSIVAQSFTGSFTGSFNGSGANLTNLPTTTWNGIRNGNAQITGSLIVSGAVGTTVNFTGVSSISGSIFSGSFRGDGSQLTGINVGSWDGTRNGNAQITGSLIVSGSILTTGIVTITSGSVSSQPGVNIIHIATPSLSAPSTTLYNFPLNASTGYTGFKADYTLTNAAETSKKVGTLLGSWDRSGNAVINDSYTLATGDITSTAFSINATSTTASLNVGVSTGTFELNMLITAFKRSI
jgi:hypothetical protein